MTNEDFMERIACELTELNTTLSCRFDVLDDIATHLKAIAYGSDLAFVEEHLGEIKDALLKLDT
jgi:hypothetical protein